MKLANNNNLNFSPKDAKASQNTCNAKVSLVLGKIHAYSFAIIMKSFFAKVDYFMFNIVSYPRSGNHLVRALVENVTQRPTLGSFGNRIKDSPIFKHSKNIDPIGYKQHFVEDIDKDRLAVKISPKSLIMIARNPFDAISSHHFDYLDKYLNHSVFNVASYFFSKSCRRLIQGQRLVSSPASIKHKLWRAKFNSIEEFIALALVHWVSLHQLYVNWNRGPNLLLKFENLVDATAKTDEIGKLYTFLDKSNCAKISFSQLCDEANLQSVYGISQKSLKRPSGNRKKYNQLIYDCFISSPLYTDEQFFNSKQFITENYLS